jgi:hypothetical protein
MEHCLSTRSTAAVGRPPQACHRRPVPVPACPGRPENWLADGEFNLA